MPEPKPRYANFPEREPKVVLGEHISATMTKSLTKLTIGTYEMSTLQMEKGQSTTAAAKRALTDFAKANPGTQLGIESNRDYVGVVQAKTAEQEIKVWVTTPFELTQSNHLVWVRIKETKEGAEPRIGIAFKLNNVFSPDDFANIIKAAQKNLVVVPEGEAYVLKGNPPPRFQKKAVAAAPAEGAAPAEAAEATAESAADAVAVVNLVND
jgi:hypothetical protein